MVIWAQFCLARADLPALAATNWVSSLGTCSPVSSCLSRDYLVVEGLFFVLQDEGEGRCVLVVQAVVGLLRQEDLLQPVQELAVGHRLRDLLRLQGQTRLEKPGQVQQAETLQLGFVAVGLQDRPGRLGQAGLPADSRRAVV